MTPERYQKVCDIFSEAREVSPAARAEFLARACAGDAELRREVESLLASDASAGDFIDAPALEMAAGMLADEKKRSKIGLEFGQYRILSMLGAGGMGEVWLAEDSRLKRQLALKLLTDVRHPDVLRRFKQEAYAASALNHPNIITIFDIGEKDGFQFIATEYIKGRTLRRLLRESSMTTARAVEIAVGVCAALEAAHAAGIIHRDIKPENIMIRDDGIVKVLDFGLARFAEKNGAAPDSPLITKPGIVMGTVAYMSPEQARALPVDERTDVFSLGIVLYEMIAGHQPFEGVNDIEILAGILEREPAALSESCPESLRQLISKVLRKEPSARPSIREMLAELRALKRRLEFSTEIINQKTAGNLHGEETVELNAVTDGSEPAADPQPAAADRAGAGRRRLLIPVLAVVLALVAAGGYYQFFYKKNAVVLTAADKILIGEFANRTGDEEFDDTFRQPLAVSLAQSPFLSLVSDGQIRQTLKLMEKLPDQPLTGEIAREVCQRRGVKAYLLGAIENYGVEYLVVIEAFNTETGESVARETARARNKEEVLPALDEAAARIRGRLGESLASISKFDAPLQQATTSSLEALRMYSLANKRLFEAKNEEAVTLLKQATELDPDFAAAYAALGTTYYNKGQYSTAEQFAKKAFELRDRATERERLKITDFYYAAFTGESDKNIEILELFRQTYPRDIIPFVNLSSAYIQLGKFAKSEENARQAAALDSSTPIPPTNLGRALNLQGRFDEARAVYDDLRQRGFDTSQIDAGLFTAAFGRGDEAEMRKNLDELKKKEEERALLLQGNPLIFAGKWTEYVRVMTQAVAAGEKQGKDIAADYSAQVALNGAALGKCAESRKWADRALGYDHGQFVLTDASLALTLCGGAAGPLIAELKEKYPKNTVVNSIWLPLIRAAADLETAPDRALETLEINRQFEGSAYFWDNYLRGRIYLKLDKPDQAAVEFKKIVDNRGWAPQSPLFALAHLELARTAERQSDSQTARKYAETFQTLWNKADRDLLDREKIFLASIFF